MAAPELPSRIEPFSFVSAGLLRHVAQALSLSPGQTLVDLGCGRGGPGLWLAREADAALIGVDFSPVAVDQAAHRAALFGLAGRARFAVGDLTRTGLPHASADAAVSIDACAARAAPTSRRRPGPSGTTCGPASTGSPRTSVIPAATLRSPTCKTKPGAASRWQISATGSSAPRPLARRTCRQRHGLLSFFDNIDKR
jgi:hypothetical protein